MLRDLSRGAVAGMVGTMALDITTYLDVALRGRPTSSMPAAAARRLADAAHVPLASEGPDSDVARRRSEGLGALLGYAAGIGVGAAWGVARRRLPPVPVPAAGAVVGLAAMAVTDVPMVALRLTDPRGWGVAGWASDVVPHVVYGLATVAALDALARR